MNEAAREAERQKPGVCHHEAVHAVFAYHAKAPIAYVVVGVENSKYVSLTRYMRGDLVGTADVWEFMVQCARAR